MTVTSSTSVFASAPPAVTDLARKSKAKAASAFEGNHIMSNY
jgi:hypothetical protein